MPIKDLRRSFSFDLSAINCLVNLSRLQTTGRFSIIFEGAEMLHAPYCYRESWSEFLLFTSMIDRLLIYYICRDVGESLLFSRVLKLFMGRVAIGDLGWSFSFTLLINYLLIYYIRRLVGESPSSRRVLKFFMDRIAIGDLGRSFCFTSVIDRL